MIEIVLAVVVVLLLVAAGFTVVGFVKIRSVRSRHRARIASVHPMHSEPASLVGVASEGKLQTRGVGTLAVGDTHLIFVQLAPERDVLVPRDAITSTRATRHFLGKTTGNDLLVVTWDVQGMTDAVALAVPDVDAWRQRLTP